MVVFNKYHAFVEHLAEGVHNLQTAALKIALASGVNAAATGSSVLADVGQLVEGNGYILSGKAVTVTSSFQATGLYRLILGNPGIWTGGPSAMATFRYAVLYNDTPTSPADPLIGYWDYGSNVTLNSGETFTVTLDSTNGVLTLS